MSVRSILYDLGTGRAGKPVHFEIVEAYVNHVIQSSVWALHIHPGYTIHKGSTVQCYQELINCWWYILA